MAYSSWALPCPPLIVRSPDWLPSSMQTRGRYAVASNSLQLHIARYGWVFFSATSRLREAFRLVNCGWCGQRGAIICQFWCEREADAFIIPWYQRCHSLSTMVLHTSPSGHSTLQLYWTTARVNRRVDGRPVFITRQHGPCWGARVSTSRVDGPCW